MDPTENAARERANLAHLGDIAFDLSVELGRTRIPLREALALTVGAVVVVDKLAGEGQEVRAGQAMIGEGEMVVRGNITVLRLTRMAPAKR